MKWARYTTAILAFVALSAARVSGQDPDETARLRARLEAQEILNQQLLERLRALEASQAEFRERIEELNEKVPTMEAVEEEHELLREELRVGLLDLDERFELLPTITGYYDFEYLNDDRSDSPGEFRVHHVGLQFAKDYDKFRFFNEIEFEYGAKFEGAGGTELEEARGEIKVHQAWADYSLSDALNLRGGLILVPTYWGVNHAPYIQLPTRRPLLFRKIFPNNFAGLMAYGSKYWEETGLTYYAYVGNGVSDNFAKDDDNEGKAVGGKVTFHLPSKGVLETFDLSLSGYHESPDEADRVNTWGLEAQVRKGPWEVLAEYAMRDSAISRSGFFTQPSYRFNDKWATFYRYDLFDTDGDEEVQEHTLGINHRPIPEISLKLEYFYSIHSDDEDYNGVAASIAFAF